MVELVLPSLATVSSLQKECYWNTSFKSLLHPGKANPQLTHLFTRLHHVSLTINSFHVLHSSNLVNTFRCIFKEMSFSNQTRRHHLSILVICRIWKVYKLPPLLCFCSSLYIFLQNRNTYQANTNT